MRVERRVIGVRVMRRWGPARIAGLLRLNPSTVHRVLTRYQMPRLSHLDRATGQPIRRYERDAPGDLVHVDIKKLGNIPDGGGHRVTGRQPGKRHRTQTPGKTLDSNGGSHVGYSYIHTAIDDHSRVAYSEILPNEKKETACGFWRRAQAWFTAHGITVERVLTDNGACYKSFAWRDLLAGNGITHKRTRAYRPQTNGKVERLNRTMMDEWAYAKPYPTEQARRDAFGDWLHWYNHHRWHTTIKATPATRVPNLPEHYS